MPGLPKDSDAKKVIRVLRREFGWDYIDPPGFSGHVVGTLMCPENTRNGCRLPVYGTGNNTARALWQDANRCTHGASPGRAHW